MQLLRLSVIEISTAKSITNYIRKERLRKSLENCRCQGYKIETNMREGKCCAETILDINPPAYFLPCRSHSWDFILEDAATPCVQDKLLQTLYTLFSDPNERRTNLTTHAVHYWMPFYRKRNMYRRIYSLVRHLEWHPNPFAAVLTVRNPQVWMPFQLSF